MKNETNLPDGTQAAASNAQIGDWVIYKNNQLIAFDKPAGLPVQADKTGDKSLLQLAEIYSKSKLFLLHRLDRPASGVVLLGKTKTAVAAIAEQFTNRTIGKTYLAVVKDMPPKPEDVLTHFIQKKGKTNRSSIKEDAEGGGEYSELKYRLLGSSDTYHLLEIQLVTGRHHQIRAQLAAIGCPIKGDVKYGAKRGNRDRSIHLHAWKLSFRHPVSGELTELVAPLPKDVIWEAFVQQGLLGNEPGGTADL